jgi:hypothetical protein
MMNAMGHVEAGCKIGSTRESVGRSSFEVGAWFGQARLESLDRTSSMPIVAWTEKEDFYLCTRALGT